MCSLRPEKKSQFHGLRVLWADDDPVFLEIAKATLKKVDGEIEMYCAMNGEVALNFLSKNNLDIVFLDINMPVMDGWAFLESLKQQYGNVQVPICIASSSIDPGDRKKAESFSEIKLFIEKPLNPKKLTSALSFLLDTTP